MIKYLILFVLLNINANAQSCFKAPTFLVSTPKGESTTISWQKNQCAVGYVIKIRAVGDSVWRSISVGDTNKKIIYLLSYSTDYEYQIASKDSQSISSYTTIKKFSTLCECLTPIIVIDSIGFNGIKFYIDDDSCGVRYLIKVRKQNDIYWQNIVVNDSLQTFDYDRLQSNTTYIWKVRRDCNLIGYVSPFSTPYTFKTK
jgi:hypothetical protein